jgi:AraC family transcriptional regulator
MPVTSAASLAASHPAQRIGRVSRTEPDLLIAAGSGAGTLYGAIWSHTPVHAEVTGLAQHALVLHLSGCSLVEKWVQGRLLGHRARIGSVSLVPAGMASTWVLGGHSRVAHLYLDPQRLADAGAELNPAGAPLALQDFFADDDEISAALVHRVLAQAQAGTLDALAHDEAMSMLLRHLLRRHGLQGPRPHAAPSPERLTMTSATLRRLFEHIEQHLGTELRLHELAALARLSEDHFLRAFKAAVGQTPHRYVLSRRIARAQSLLQRTGLPVAAVAQETGFRGPSHFAAAFRSHTGTTPSVWRASRRH